METDKTEMVTITKAEYDRLLEQKFWLNCLEQAGVDNWQGYDKAIDIWDSLENE